MKKDMVQYCEAIKETARQKGADSDEQLDPKKLMNKIRHLEAENFMLKKQIEELGGK
jgi:dynactin complex subunit